jgi:hypothetical protein
MNQKILRALSLILIFALSLGLLSACSGNENVFSSNENPNLAEVSPESINIDGEEMAYFARIISKYEDMPGLIESVCPADGGIYIPRGIYNRENSSITSVLYFADKNGEIKGIDTPWLGESGILYMFPAEGGGIWLIKSTYISSNNYEYELGSLKNGEYSKLLKLEVPYNMHITALCATNGRLFVSESNEGTGKGKIEAYKPSGEKDFQVDISGYSVRLVSDGTSLYLGEYNDKRALKVSALDPENGDLRELIEFESGNLLACSGEKIYIGDTTGLVEYDIATKNSRRLFLWSQCGAMANLTSIWPGENGEFIVVSNGVLTKMYLDVKRERKQVIFAVNTKGTSFSQLAFEFNEENTEYEVIIKDYGAYSDPQQMLNADILSGKSPDLIDASSFSGDMIKHGTMQDLMKYLEADPDLKEKGLVQGALDAMKTKDGELLTIAPKFYAFTLFCRKGAIDTGKFEGVADALNKLGSPDEAFAGTLSREAFLSFAFCCGDADKYSSKDIAAIIEYASKLPIEEDHTSEYENLRNGKQRVLPTVVGATSHLFSRAIEFLGCESFKEMELLGLPFREGTGVLIPTYSFAIPANADNPDGAWAFIKKIIMTHDDPWFTTRQYFYLRKDIYENYKESSEKSVRKKYEEDYETIGYMVTEEDIAQSKELTDKIVEGLNGVFDNDAKVYEIVTDACGAYFAGQKSLDATADEIVSRLGIYFSEQS